MREDFRILRDAMVSAGNAFNHAVDNCQHNVVRSAYGEGAICSECELHLGWFCEKAPTKLCEYDWEMRGEYCIHCDDPEKRK
jgi:hypothetical protein